MPYLPPPPEDLDPELACALVFYPDSEEYRRALFGQIKELTDVWNWEADRDTQAAIRAAWLAAELETIECANMACLEDILALLAEIRDHEWCCEGNFLFEGTGDGSTGETFVWPVDGPGPAPLPVPDNDVGAGEYPITPATDPDDDGVVLGTEWEQYVCGAANYLIDSVVDWLRFTLFLVNTQQMGIRVVQWLVTRIVGVLIPGVVDDFALYELDDWQNELYSIWPSLQAAQLETAISQLENIRDDVACAVVGEDVAANSITAALNLISGEIQNATILAFITTPVGILASLIWNGALDTTWDEGCNCPDEVTSITWSFDADAESWQRADTNDEPTGPAPWTGVEGNPAGSLLFDSGPRYRSPVFNLAAGDTVALTVETSRQGGDGAARNSRWRLVDESLTELVEIGVFGATTQAWSSETQNGDVTGFTGGQVYLVANYTNTQQVFVDNVTLSIS